MSATEKNIYFPSRNEELQLEVEAGNVLGSKCKNNRRGGLASNGWPLHRSCNDVIEKLPWPFRGGGGYFLMRGEWSFAAGWGRIFTTGLIIMGSHF